MMNLAHKIKALTELRPIDPQTWALIQKKLLLEWTYHSNAIEGNTLTYQETSFYLLRGLTAHGKSLEEHLEIANHAEAAQFLQALIADKGATLTISEKLVRELHSILFKGIGTIKIGPGLSIPARPGACASHSSRKRHDPSRAGQTERHRPSDDIAHRNLKGKTKLPDPQKASKSSQNRPRRPHPLNWLPISVGVVSWQPSFNYVGVCRYVNFKGPMLMRHSVPLVGGEHRSTGRGAASWRRLVFCGKPAAFLMH